MEVEVHHGNFSLSMVTGRNTASNTDPVALEGEIGFGD